MKQNIFWGILTVLTLGAVVVRAQEVPIVEQSLPAFTLSSLSQEVLPEVIATIASSSPDLAPLDALKMAKAHTDNAAIIGRLDKTNELLQQIVGILSHHNAI